MKKITLFSIITITFLGISFAQAQISFQAIPQKKEVGLNEPIRIQFILSLKNKEVKDIGNIKLPAFTNTQIIEKQMIQNQSYDNDGVIIEYGIEIGLRAIKTGSIKIGSASVVVEGKVYRTKPMLITVNNAPEQEERISASRMGEAFLALKVSDKTPYQNEGVIAQLKFYTRRLGLLYSITGLAPPNFQGLFVQPIKKIKNSNEQEEVVINGENYISKTIVSYVIFPSKSGQIIIDPFTLTLTIPDGFFDEQEIYIKSAPINLQVKKLPDSAPENFYGVVGDYKIKAVSNKKNLKTSEPATINIEISGKGNIGLIKSPSLIIPKGIEGFAPKSSKLESVPSTEGVLGKISTSTILIPHQSGKYDIKIKSFSFFDPEEKIFKQLSVEPITLNVLEDSTTKNNNLILPLTSDSMKSKTYIPDLKVKEVITDVLDGKEKSNKVLFITIGILSALGVVYFIFIRKKKSKKEEIKEENVSESERKIKFDKLASLSQENQKKDFLSELFQLKKIAEKGEDKKEFYTLLESILQQAINQNLKISETQFITSAEIDEKLTNKFGDEFSEECKNVLLKSQIERYSNLSDGDESLTTAYLKIEEIINMLS